MVLVGGGAKLIRYVSKRATYMIYLSIIFPGNSKNLSGVVTGSVDLPLCPSRRVNHCRWKQVNRLFLL